MKQLYCFSIIEPVNKWSTHETKTQIWVVIGIGIAGLLVIYELGASITE